MLHGTNSHVIVVCSLSLLLVLVTDSPFLQSQSTFAQLQSGGNASVPFANTNATNSTTQTPTMKTYQNPEWGISMQYPSNWRASTAGLEDYIDLIAFYSPLYNLSDFLPPAQVVLSLTRFQQNVSLSEYTNQTLTTLYNIALQMSQNQTQPSISVRSSDPVMVAEHPGHRIVSLISDPNNQSSSVIMQIWTLVDSNKLYTITYAAENNKFSENLPDVTDMINSLRIANSTSTLTPIL